jgi:FkbM family methyltransferase
MNLLKKWFIFLLKKRGYKLSKIYSFEFGRNFQDDISFLFSNNSLNIIFDVGANMGQSISLFKNRFPKSQIYSFEPISDLYRVLKEKFVIDPSIKIFNFAVGSNTGEISFFENSESDMSSILKSGKDCWGDLKSQYKVPMVDLDSFCNEHGIQFIDLLKSDTQGFDFEVLKGAKNLLKGNRIKYIYIEFIFSDMYDDLPNFSDVFKFLTVDNSYKLVSVYNFNYKDEKVSWADILFVSDKSISS